MAVVVRGEDRGRLEHGEPVEAVQATWNPAGQLREALRGLVGFGQGLASVAIVLLVWSPVWLPLALAGLWLRRRWRSRAAKPRMAPAE